MLRLRPAVADLTTGLAAFAAWAATLLVHARSPRAFEYAVLVVPAALFPLATWYRARRATPPRWTTALRVNAWLAVGVLAAAWSEGPDPVFLLSLVAAPIAGAALAAATAGRMGRVLGIAVLLAPAAVTFALVPRIAERLLVRPASGSRAPALDLELVDGGHLAIGAHPGRVVVLNFWGVWCDPCVRELPELEEVVRSDRGRGAAFVAIDSALGDETRSEVQDFVARHGLTIPVAYDPDRVAYRAFDVHGLPTTIVVDAQGNVRFRRVGYLATARYREWLTGAIAELERGR
jgi:thiol-disulfide isomerase/thioredoxin